MTDAAKALADAPTTITVGGETLALRELRFGQVFQVLDLVGPFLGELLALDTDQDVFPLLARAGAPVVELLALATGQSAEWIAALAPDEGIELAAEVWAVNRDFFIRRLMPALTKSASKFGLTGLSLTNLTAARAKLSGASGSSASAS